MVGPVAFVAAWAIGGARMPAGYSPVDDAISRIAAVGSPQRTLMTAGFVVYAVGVGVGSWAARSTVLRIAWPLLATNAAATAAVAALPLDHSATIDGLHGVAAGIGYLSISLAPLVAATKLRRRGWETAAAASATAGVISALCLIATVFGDRPGLFQRAGLTAGDIWLVAAGIGLVAGRAGRRTVASAEVEDR